MRLRIQLVPALFAAFLAAEACALDVQLVGERVWFNARGAPVAEVLRGFARAGVRVRLDPEIEASVSGRVADEAVEPVLQRLLEPFGYVLIWDVIEGPIGRFPKLSEIQVFKPGHKDKMQPLQALDENFAFITGPDGRGPRFVKDEILIGFRTGTRRDEFERLIREIGGSVVDSVPGVGVYLVRLPPGTNIPDLIAQLSRNPLIAHVEPNYITDVGSPFRVDGREGIPPGAVSPAGRGTVPVAVLDSGLSRVAGLDGVVVGTYDAVNPERELADRLGHGTQMALIAAGLIAPGSTGDHASKDVPVVAVRAFDDNGNASTYSLMRSVTYALDQGARVINMSWGTETASEFLGAAIRYAQSRGAVVVAAAGNEPTGQPIYPAAYSGVVAVSALGADGGLWSQSNTGGFVSFAAPGTASFPIGYGGPPGSYAGTSISSAYIAYALALYLSENPSSSPADAVAALRAAARDAGAEGRDPLFGYGVVDEEVVFRLLQ